MRCCTRVDIEKGLVLDLAQAPLGQDPLDNRMREDALQTYEAKTYLCVDIGDLLNGAALAGATMFCSNNAAIRALTQLLHELVLGVDDECRVEGGEGVSLHGG